MDQNCQLFPRSVSRFISVQGIFQAFSCKNFAIESFLDFRLDSQDQCDLFDDGSLHKADRAHLLTLLQGTLEKQEVINEHLQTALSAQRTVLGLELVTRAILLCGIWELLFSPKTPIKVILDEYITISKCLLSEKGYGFINGVLDKLAGQIRSDRPRHLVENMDMKTVDTVA